jgi:hypothetical protein
MLDFLVPFSLTFCFYELEWSLGQGSKKTTNLAFDGMGIGYIFG